MARFLADDIRRTGNYLLEILKREKEVRYSQLADGEGAVDKLKKAIARFDGRDDEPDSPHLNIVLAVGTLITQGFVERTFLDDSLQDGSLDFLVTLTENGAKRLADGETAIFQDVVFH